MPLINDNKINYNHRLRDILKILKKKYALVVIDTLNSPYPGYEGYIEKIDHDIVYLSSSISESPYVVVPISNIVDIYAINVEVDKKHIGKIRDDIAKIIQEELKYKDVSPMFKAIREIIDSEDDSLLLKIYTKSIVYPVYDEVKLEQIGKLSEDFLFIYYEDITKNNNNEVIIIFPLNFIDSIIVYNDIENPVIEHLSKNKIIKSLYDKSKDELISAKNYSEEQDSED